MTDIADARNPGKMPRPGKRLPAQDIGAAPTSTRHALHVVAARLSERTGIPYVVCREHAAAAGLGGLR